MTRYGTPGALATMLYLMAEGKSKREKYKLLRSEAQMDWGYKDKAIEYWLTLAQGGLKPVRDAAYPLEGDEIKEKDKYRGRIFPTGKGNSTPVAYKKAALASGWFAFLAHGADGVTAAKVRLKWYFKVPGGHPEVDPDTNEPVICPKTGKQRMVVGPDEPESYDDVLFGGIELQTREKDGSEDKELGGDDTSPDADTPAPPSTLEMYQHLEAQYPGEMLVLYVVLDNPKTGKPDPATARYQAFGTAADELVKQFKVKYSVSAIPPLNQATLSREEWILKKAPATLIKAGKRVREILGFDVDKTTGYYVVTESKEYGPKAE